MPALFGANRPRLELTGLEEPEELWERLQDATARVGALTASNRKLAGRVQALERRLSEAGSLTDDELVAELPRRMSRALETAQGVADEIVRRARVQEDSIRQKAEDAATGIVRQAEVQAGAIVSKAKKEAAARVESAEAEAHEIVRAAEDQRECISAELTAEATALRQSIVLLERNRARLVRALDVVEQTLTEARSAMGTDVVDNVRDPTVRVAPPVAPARLARPDRKGPVGPAPAGQTSPADSPTEPRSKLYDWSPAASQAG